MACIMLCLFREFINSSNEVLNYETDNSGG